jgi:hypothetical protein
MTVKLIIKLRLDGPRIACPFTKFEENIKVAADDNRATLYQIIHLPGLVWQESS